jgi:hypothetical protein
MEGSFMRRITVSIILVLVSLVFLQKRTSGEEFCVGTATELHNALTAAQTNGEDDIIWVKQGTYYGNFVYNSTEGKDITLLGGYTSGCLSRVLNPANTILDGSGAGPVLRILEWEGGAIYVEGFTIQNGFTSDTSLSGGINTSTWASDIWTFPDDIVITHNIIKGNTGRGSGGINAGSSAYNPANVVISYNIIRDNHATDNSTARGGGASATTWGSSPGQSSLITVIGNVFEGNTSQFDGGGVYVSAGSSAGNGGRIVMTNNIIVNNTADSTGGGALVRSYSNSSSYPGDDVKLTNNTIADNTAGFDAGGLYLRMDENHADVYNNIIWGNTSPDIKIYNPGIPGTLSGYNNDYPDMAVGWTYSGGNIHDDPLFVGDNDYRLSSISPCIDKGTNSAPNLPIKDINGDPRIIDGDNDGTADVDIGADEYVFIPIFIFDGHDFNGDGSSDASVFRPSEGRWYIKDVGSYKWGASEDIPVNGDYNGDGTTDIAAWRPSNGWWYLKGIGGTSWGTSGDIPVPGNYDGDVAETTDIAVWRPSNGRWYIKGIGGHTWGTAGDIPVPGDYNGDGITDIAVWRPSNGRWYIKGIGGHTWGTLGDVPVPADYNGDGVTDIAVWRSSNSRWYIKGIGVHIWGGVGDIPVPGDYNGDGIIDIAVWRPSNGRWYIKGIGGYLWGTFGDIALVR